MQLPLQLTMQKELSRFDFFQEFNWNLLIEYDGIQPSPCCSLIWRLHHTRTWLELQQTSSASALARFSLAAWNTVDSKGKMYFTDPMMQWSPKLQDCSWNTLTVIIAQVLRVYVVNCLSLLTSSLLRHYFGATKADDSGHHVISHQ